MTHESHIKTYSSHPTHLASRGGDFLFDVESIENRWGMVQEAKKQWDDGAIISIMW